MNKNGKLILAFLVIAIIAGIMIYILFNYNNQNNTSSYDASKISTNTTSSQNAIFDNSSNNNVGNVSQEVRSATEGMEREVSKFSTKIIDKDDNRDNNMKISLSKLNNLVVKNGDTFSFNEVVGSPTADKGYKKAGVFVGDEYKKDYGGGNCQVSSTLYNAVRKVDGLKVTERHQHTLEVYYVELGNDAAVAYGELDLKFKNETGHDIKIYTDFTESKVSIKLTELN